MTITSQSLLFNRDESVAAYTTTLDPLALLVQPYLSSFFAQSDYLTQLAIPFSATAGTEAWTTNAEDLRSAILNGSYGIRLEVRSSSELQGVKGAYSPTGTMGTPTIYLNGDWLATASQEQITAVLLEEIGHDFDNILNAGADSPGDEGKIFSNLVLGNSYDLTALQSQEDSRTLSIDGTDVAVETSSHVLSGTVFQDRAGNLLADGAVGDTNNPGISGVTVRLFNSAGNVVASTTTDASGQYVFSGVADNNATYYIAVARPASGGAISEQTYAAAGIGNSGTAGGTTGYGALVVSGGGTSTAPTYLDSGATVIGGNAVITANGAAYGGRRGATADNPGTTLNDNEHVTRVVVGSSDVTAVDFGFSYNVVTNTANSGQGSVRQFITNANALGGAGNPMTMRFVPAEGTNQTSGSNTWWQTSATSSMPLTGASTTIDGTARWNTDGETVVETYAGSVGTGGTVGVDALALSQVPAPELVVSFSSVGLSINTSNVVLRDMGITRTAAQHAIRHRGSGFTVERAVLGFNAAQFDAGAAITGLQAETLFMLGNSGPSSNVSISNSLVAGNTTSLVINNTSTVTDITVTNNELIGGRSGQINTSFGAGGTTNGWFNATIEGNLFRHSSRAAFVDDPGDGRGGNLILRNNTLRNNGDGALAAIWVPGEKVAPYLIERNIVTDNNGAGVSFTTGQQVHITQNSFSNNTGNAIDLNSNGVSTATATGADNPSSGTANGGIPRPAISLADLSGANLTLSGTYSNVGTYTLEFYKVAAGSSGDVGGDGLQAGEGEVYLGALTGLTGGTFTDQTLTVSGLTSTDRITAIAIREDGASTAGNTSEFSVKRILNRPPVALPDIIPVTENKSTVPFNILANDTDPDGLVHTDTFGPGPTILSSATIDINGDGDEDTLMLGPLGTPTAITSPGGPIGTITVAADGIVVFTPAKDYTGPVPLLTYTANDGYLDSLPTTVSFPITPDDSPTTITITSPGTVGEVDGGEIRTVNFSLGLSRPASEVVTVKWRTSVDPDKFTASNGVFATPDVDYVHKEGIVTFLPGSTAQVITVVTIGDDTEEADESLFIELYDAQGAALGGGNSELVIVDNDGINAPETRPNNPYDYSTSTEPLDLRGGIESDVLIGGSADDQIYGDPIRSSAGGNDILIGGLGADTLTGGPGADFFDYPSFSHSNALSRDRIRDFNPGQGDRIRLVSLPTAFFNRGLISGVDNFNVAATAAFADRDRLTDGNQQLLANEAVLFAFEKTPGNSRTRKWFIGVNDDATPLSSSADLMINVTGLSNAKSYASGSSTPLTTIDFFATI